jgi:alpha-ketoglutarate-dependent taurine dioxygenase/1,4-dihydroxy-2-naphthoate octaprenyltransferase
MNPTLVPLTPFGVRVECPSGTQLADLEAEQLTQWVDRHRVVQLRGVTPVAPHVLAAQCRRLGPLQPWSFGAVHELKQVERPENYLYTEHAVPLHWDGAFADAVPHWLVFQCVRAPPEGAGGETVFVDSTRVLQRSSPAQRANWQAARVRYSTEKKVHYGGTFVSPVVATHPTLGFEVLRYAEPVRDLNPVSVEPLGLNGDDARALQEDLSRALADPDAVLAVPWAEGDFVIADNHALLHGRRAFVTGAPRHLHRVNVLDADQRWWARLRAAWRVRRPEFFRAELPILLLPALLSANTPAALTSLAFLEGVAVFFLLFNVGDMINCWFDRDVDLHRKTHLAEAIALVGRRSLMAQIVLSALAATGLAVHLALTLQRWWLAPAGLVGAVLGASYTAPPLRLKSRGLLQLPTYVGLLFVGPMMLVAGLFRDQPGLDVVLTSLAFGAMQTGVLLVNTAEDLDEDERERIRTAAVVLQARGTITLAQWLVLLGGVGLTAVLQRQLPGMLGLALAPLLATTAWNARWLAVLSATQRPLDEAGRRAAVREQGKHVPRRIESGAWAAAFAALVAWLAKVVG